jgi:hypothetical protein
MRGSLRTTPQHLGGPLSDLGGRAIGFVHKGRDRGPAHRLDADLRLLGIRKQGRVFHGAVEAFAQRYRIKKLLKPNEHTYGIEWIYGHDVTAGTRAQEPATAA